MNNDKLKNYLVVSNETLQNKFLVLSQDIFSIRKDTAAKIFDYSHVGNRE